MIKKLHVFYILFLLTSSINAQNIHFVKSGANGNGSSWSNASGNLQATINTSNSGDTIYVAQGTYQPLVNTSFSMKEGVIIYGGFPNTGNPTMTNRNHSIFTTTLLGNGSNVIKNNTYSPTNSMTAASILDGFIITGGVALNGAGILNYYASPILRNLVITGNTSISPSGSGVDNSHSSPMFINVLIHHNIAHGNSPDVGGAVINSQGSPIFINSTIADNSSDAIGGGIYNQNANPKFYNCIIYGNTSISNSNFNNQSSLPDFKHSLIQGCGSSTIYPNGNQWSVSYGNDMGGNLDENPLFTSNYSLQTASSAINSGKNTLYNDAPVDFFGNTRIIDVIDMGYAEWQSTISTILYVKEGATGNGSSWADASGDLRAMTKLQVTGGAIWVAMGTYTPTQLGDFFYMKEGVKIYGGFPSTGNPNLSNRNPEIYLTTLLANGECTVCNYNRADSALSISSELDGFTITRTNPTPQKAGIYNLNASPKLKNLKILNNTASGMINIFSSPSLSNSYIANNSSMGGGGIFNNASSPIIDTVIFENNSGSTGGGIYSESNGTLSIHNTTFLNNTGGSHGGAICISSGILTISNSYFTGNSAGWGGAVQTENTTSTLLNCIFSKNNGSLGAAIQIQTQSSMALTNVLISKNNATSGGGGIFNSFSSVTMTNVTISNNKSGNINGGYEYSNYSTSKVRNSIIFGNFAVQNPNISVYNNNPNIYFENSIIQGSGGSSNWNSSFGTNNGNNLDTDPLFVFSEGGNYKLIRCSPAINAGNNAMYNVGVTPNLSSVIGDVINEPRFYNSGIVDIGAFEYQSNDPGNPIIIYVKQNAVGLKNGTSWVNAFNLLQEGISAACSGDQIWVTEGTYQPAVNNSFQLRNGIIIYGGFPEIGGNTLSNRNWGLYPSVLKGNNNSVIANIYSISSPLTNSAILDGFTIQEGIGYKFNPNNSNTYGGGIINRYASPVLNNLIIRNNTAFAGGGIYNTLDSNSILTNVIISNNTATNNGGGISTESSTPIVINSTIAGNLGGGLRNGANTLPIVKNSIIYGNTNNGLSQNVNGGCASSYSIIQGSGGSSNWNINYGTNGGNNLDSNPLFAIDFSLLNGSPAIDSGSNSLYNSGNSPFDVAGNPRIYGTNIDRGAYEYNPTLSIDDHMADLVTIYPIPVIETLYIKLHNDIIINSMIIYDLNGRKILEDKNISDRVNVQLLSKGLYLIKFETNKGTIVNKFTK